MSLICHEHQQAIAHTKTHLFALEGLSERGLEVAHVCYGVVIGWSADVEDGRQFVTPYICICIYVYMYMYIYIYTNIHIGRAAVRYSLYMYMYICIYVYVYLYIYKHTYRTGGSSLLPTHRTFSTLAIQIQDKYTVTSWYP